MERIRAFVALNLPVPVIEQISKLQVELGAEAERVGLRVAWVPATNLHVTLRFLGEMPRETAFALRDRLVAGVAGRRSFGLQVRGVGAFPEIGRPRVLWVGLRDDEGALARLAAEVGGWVDELGFAPEPRPFHPHLTLGRVKEGAGDGVGDGAGDIGTRWADHVVGPTVPTEVVLYSSELQRRGAEYTAIARFALQRSGRGER